MLKQDYYALVADKTLKYVNETVQLLSAYTPKSPEILNKEINGSIHNEGFDKVAFFLNSKEDDILYANTNVKIHFNYDYGYQSYYYIFSKEMYDFLNENCRFAPHIVRKFIINNKGIFLDKEYLAVYFLENNFLDLNQSQYFREKNSNSIVVERFLFSNEANNYDIFNLEWTIFSFTLVVTKKAIEILETKKFTGFIAFPINDLKAYNEKLRGYPYTPKGYKPKLP